MKAAQVNDWRRRLITKADQWSLRLSGVAAEEVINVGTVEIPITLPLTVLCGPNGVGKSTLIKALFASLQSGEIDLKVEPLLAQGRGIIRGKVGSTDFEIARSLAAPGVQNELFPTAYLETSKEPKTYQDHFRTFDSINDIVNGLAKVSLNNSDLEEIGFLLGRDYRSIDVYEYGEEERWPFFEVSRGDDRYDTRTMGAGELACFHLWWRLKFIDKNSLLFVEEPETYISPYAQKSFAAFLMRFLYRNKSVGIVVSHSASFIQAVPLQSVVFVTRLGPNMETIARPPVSFLKKIGMTLVVDTVCCVEDTRAQDFLRAILLEFAYDQMQTTAIHISGSDGEVTKSVTGATGLPDTPRLFAVYDGDMHDKLPEGLTGFSAALPGTQPIEEIFRAFVSENAAEITTAMGQDIRPILDSIEGIDPHDWFTTLAENLHVAVPALFNVIFNLWVKVDANADACKAFVNTLFPPADEPPDEEVDDGPVEPASPATAVIT